MLWLFLILLIPYLYLLLKIYSGLQKINPYLQLEKNNVFVSVIVACRNEENNIELLLSDISAQNYAPDLFELIVVDDNSIDKTYEIAAGFRKIKNLKVLRNKGTGKKKAIKTGVEESRGELIITTDADCHSGNNWLKAVASFYSEYKPEMIICPVVLHGGSGFCHWFQEIEFLSLQGITAGAAMIDDPVMCNGANLAFTKEAYLVHSGNLHDDMVSGDDIFLLHSIKRESGTLIRWIESPDAVVITKTSETLSAFISQRARWISKAGSYSDRLTLVLAIITLVTIFLELVLLVAGIFNPLFVQLFLAALLIKSIPDLLILRNTTLRHKKKNLLWFFLPAQLLYPFYVLAVVIYYLFTRTGYSSEI